MERLRKTLRAHWPVISVTAILTLVMTYPTIVHVFRTDVFWLPTGSSADVFNKLWDVWHGRQLLNGSADYYFTNKMFYPAGVSLVYHPFFALHVLVVNLLQRCMPLSNAYSAAYMLSVAGCALRAYVYLRYLIRDKWAAIFGAVIVGFSPHVLGHPNHPSVAFVAPLPLALYFLHRGVVEDRRSWMIAAGALTGFTAYVTLYTFVCLLITMGFLGLALALTRWRHRGFWLNVSLLVLVALVLSSGRILPMTADLDSASAAVGWHGERDDRDLLSAFINHRHPLLGPPLETLLQLPNEASINEEGYLGFIPLLLIGIGLYHKSTRIKMLPWLIPFAAFFLLRLGSTLNVNGIAYPAILLPKHFLNHALPFVFQAFTDSDHFQIGLLLPFAILSGYGVAGLCQSIRADRRPQLIMLLVIVVAFEYYVPIADGVVTDVQVAYLDWLNAEEDAEIALVNVPMGRGNSKTYNLYQVLSDYPHVEGAISRTPDRAYDYIRANYILERWYTKQAAVCGWHNENLFLSALDQLASDGFSHVVFHQSLEDADRIADSFLGASASYEDAWVAIYRLGDLRATCPGRDGIAHQFSSPYADILLMPSVIHERAGTVVTFHQRAPADPHFLRNFQHRSIEKEQLVQVSDNAQGGIVVQSTHPSLTYRKAVAEHNNAFWVVNDPLETVLEEVSAYQDWFKEEFKNCRRFMDRADATIDLYISQEMPCAAVAQSSEFEVLYDTGDRLHNVYMERSPGASRFYLVWSNATAGQTQVSLQFFDQGGEKALQHDSALWRKSISVHDVDISSLRAGAYTVKLILYDFASGSSYSGTFRESGEHFERAAQIATLEI